MFLFAFFKLMCEGIFSSEERKEQIHIVAIFLFLLRKAIFRGFFTLNFSTLLRGPCWQSLLREVEFILFSSSYIE